MTPLRRLFAFFTLLLLIAFSGFGLAIARPWGWTEYESPQLYVVYYQIGAPYNPYFIVSTDGSDSSQPLTSPDGTISQLDCSPDGRTFAVLTNTDHLYVLTAAGLSYERAIDLIFTTVSVADDGSTALFDPAADRLQVGSRTYALPTSDQKDTTYDRIDISAQGLILWMRDFNDIQVVSPADGSVTPYVPHGYSGQWFASGQMITYLDNATDAEGNGLYGGEYLMDLATQLVVKIGDWDLSRPISPDGTVVAAPLVVNQKAQIVVYDLFTNADRRVLTHDPDHASQPACFLTFVPKLFTSG